MSLANWLLLQPPPPPAAPNSPMHFYEKLETTLDNVVTKNILLLGDFNAKHQEWYSQDLTTHHGSALKDLMDSYGLTQVCTEPAHLNQEGKPNSLPDLVFTNDTDTFHSSVDVLPLISTSDHLPVFVHYCPAKDNLSQNNKYPSKKYIKWHFSQKRITITWQRHSFLKIGNMSLTLLSILTKPGIDGKNKFLRRRNRS